MSLFDYVASRALAGPEVPFAALIMAAVRKADIEDFHALEAAFPDIVAELRARYHAPGGRLDTDAKAPITGEGLSQ